MMRALLALLFAALLPLVWPASAMAQSAATLVADNVSIPAGGEQLIASGNVEVFFEGNRLSARRIVFDRASDRLVIEGPIFIVASDGTILTATQAELDPRLENGILRGARLVLDQQLQLAANQIDRVEGRYTQLYQVAATSCQVCQNGGTPLWEIRARRVVHDQDERQLYFDDASFRVAGVPVFWLPRMRLPDPTLPRATGLMLPQITTSDTLGTGIKVPYFIRLGDHRDLTLTPYLTTSSTTLEARYRQAFLRGDIEIEGAVSNDNLHPDTRSYLFGRGVFDLGSDYKLRLGLEMASDTDYLLDYGYSGKDRLVSQVAVSRVRDRDILQSSATYYSTLRETESATTLPPVLTLTSWERRLSRLGGTLTLASDIDGHYREKPVLEPVSGMMVDDATRLGFGADWHGSTVLGAGLVVEGGAGIALDYYTFGISSDASDTLRGTTYAQTTLRYPMVRHGAQATHLLEPVVQLAWSDVQGGTIPNEDSTATEFDQANLLSLSRFTGQDAVETGARAAIGLTWTRLGENGWDSTLSVGRVFRAQSDTRFSPTSGLAQTTSDWLVAGQLKTGAGFSIDGRVLVDETLGITRSEARTSWTSRRFDIEAGYIFLPDDTQEGRTEPVSEWTFDSTYRIDDTWTLGFDTRYDVVATRPTRTGLSVGWQNECVTVDFSVSRRNTSSSTLTPSTDFGLSIGLNGFSAGRAVGGPANRCTD